jgi:hypothetical protein
MAKAVYNIRLAVMLTEDTTLNRHIGNPLIGISVAGQHKAESRILEIPEC